MRCGSFCFLLITLAWQHAGLIWIQTVWHTKCWHCSRIFFFFFGKSLFWKISAEDKKECNLSTMQWVNNNILSEYWRGGAQWLSGRVLDSRPRGCWFEPHWRHCVMSLRKTHSSLLSTGSTHEDPFWHDWKNVDWDVKNKIKQKQNIGSVVVGCLRMGSRGHWFESDWRYCVVSSSKTLCPLLSIGTNQELSQHDWKFVYWDIMHQLEQKSWENGIIVFKCLGLCQN